jgi:outer membrane protein assembly factor BamB
VSSSAEYNHSTVPRRNNIVWSQAGIVGGPFLVHQLGSPASTSEQLPRRSGLRLSLAVVIIAIQWLFIIVPGWVVPGTTAQLILLYVGALIGGVGVTVWWLRLGQLLRSDRALVVVSFVGCGAGIVPLCHPTFVDQFRGPILDGIPLVATAWVLWLLVSGRFPWAIRRVGVLAAIAFAWGYCTLLRIDGVNARYEEEIHWRWDPTAEERFLAELAGRKVSEPRPQPL